MSEYSKEYYKKNKERIKEMNKNWRINNRELYLELLKNNYKKHKEVIYKQQTEYRHRNSKKISQMVLNCKRRRVQKLREQGCTNAWMVVNKQTEPRFKKSNLIEK